MTISPSTPVHYSREAGVDLSSAQYELMQPNASDGDIETVGSDGAFSMGVLQNAPKAGETAKVTVLGPTKVKLGATLSAGDRFMAGGTGNQRAIKYTTTATHYCLGYLIDGGVDGDVVDAVITHAGRSTS